MFEGVSETGTAELLELVANLATALAVVAVLVAVIQYFGDLKRRRTEFLRTERARQETAFETVTTHYMNFLSMCMDNPDLTLSRLAISGVRDQDRPEPDPVRDLILFEYFFAMLEKVYVLYRADELYEVGPSGSFDFSRLDPAVVETMRAADSETFDLRHRQWWGWDEWIESYLDSPLAEPITTAWFALDNDSTNDSGFGSYMNHRITQAAQRRSTQT